MTEGRTARKLWLSGVAVILVGVMGLVGCREDTPMGLDGDLIPLAPRTVVVELPWDDFATGLEVMGGFGTAIELPSVLAAHEFGGVLESRVLVQWTAYPSEASVVDSLGVQRVDTAFTFPAGRIVARIDTLESVAEGPIEFTAYLINTKWDARTASWTLAVDTAGAVEPWDEPGAGPVTEMGSGTWVPEEGDSLVIELDSVAVARWQDTTLVTRSMRLDMTTPGGRVAMTSLNLRLDARPSIHLDTLVTLGSTEVRRTFIYDPVPGPPTGGFRIGGVPAWRTIMHWDMPGVLNGPPEFCARVGCPFTLVPSRINAATLILRSAPGEPAFQPSDTVRLDVRAVLAPDRLPKSPLGPSFIGGLGRPVKPEAFGELVGQEIPIPVTGFVRDLVEGPVDDVEPPRVMALLSYFEPLSIAFATFAGLGDEGEPFLRLILTTSDTVEIR